MATAAMKWQSPLRVRGCLEWRNGNGTMAGQNTWRKPSRVVCDNSCLRLMRTPLPHPAVSERHLVRVLAQMQAPLGLVLEFAEGAPIAEKPNLQVSEKRGAHGSAEGGHAGKTAHSMAGAGAPQLGPALTNTTRAPPCSCLQSLLRCRWAPGRTFQLAWVLKVAIGVAAALEHCHYRWVGRVGWRAGG